MLADVSDPLQNISAISGPLAGSAVYELTPQSTIRYRPVQAAAARPEFDVADAPSYTSETSFSQTSQPPPAERSTEAFRPPEQRPQPTNDLQEWFRTLIQSRQRSAVKAVCVTAACVFVAVILFLQFSLLAPLHTFKVNVASLCSPSLWILAGLHGALYFLVCDLFLRFVISPFYERNISLAKRENALALIVLLVTQFAHVLLLTLYADVELSWSTSSSAWALVVLASFVSSARIAYLTDYRCQFTHHTRHGEPVTSIKYYGPWLAFFRREFGLAEDSPPARSFMEALRTLIVSWPIVFVLAVVHPTLRLSALSLINPATLLEVFVVISAQQLLASCAVSLVNENVMKPLMLRMPTVYFAAENARSMKTLLNALRSDDHLLRMFGFRDLRLNVDVSMQDRADVYALSQPGGHPRNWSSVKSACLWALQLLQDQLEGETEKSMTGTYRPLERREPQSPSGLDETRATLLLPPNLQPRFNVLAPSQHTVPFWHRIPIPPTVLTAIEWARRTFFQPTPSISTYMFCLSKNAIKALAIIVVNSLYEDQYGVVQRDVSTVLSALLKLEVAIDGFIRAKEPSSIEARNAIHLEEILVEYIRMIKEEFGGHMTSMHFSKTEQHTLDTITSP